MQTYNHNDINPFIGCDEPFMKGRNGEYTIGYKMELPPIFTLDEEIQDKLVDMFCKGIRILPNFCRIHRQDFISERLIDLSSIPKNDYFTKSYFKTFSKNPVRILESYIYFTLIPSNYHNIGVMNGATTSGKGYIRFREEHIIEFREKVEQFIAFMKSVRNQSENGQPSYINFELLNSENYLANVSSSEKDGVIPKSLFLGEINYGDISYDRKTSTLRVGENMVDIFSLSALNDLPPEVNSSINYDTYDLPMTWGAATSVLLPFPHIVNTYIIKGDSEVEKKKLTKRQKYLNTLSHVSPSNSLGADEITGFLNYTEENKAIIIDAYVNIIFWDQTEKGMAIKRQSVNTNFSSYLGCQNPKIESYNKLNLFIASLPGNAINIFKEYRFKTIDMIGAILNNYNGLLKANTQQNGYWRVIDRFSQSPVQVDLTEPHRKHKLNKNIFVIGGSGSGKSFTINSFLDIEYQNGSHIVIVDKGRSFEGIASAYNAKWYEYTETDPLSFNPFILSPSDYEESTRQLCLHKEQALVGIIKLLWKGEKGTFTQMEENQIKEVIGEYYRDTSITIRKFDTFYDFATKYKFCVDFDMETFSYNLKTCYKGGRLSKLLNADFTKSMLDDRLIVFELDSIKDEPVLLAITTAVITDVFAAKMQDVAGPKFIFFDEAWAALTNKEMTIYMKWLSKTARKHDTSLGVITQELEDIIDSEIGVNLMNNSSIRVLLDQSSNKKNFDKIQKFVGLNDFQKAQVLSINKGKKPGDPSRDVFISFSNGKSFVVQVSVSRAQALLYTSEQNEKLGIRYVSDKLGLSYAEAIQYIIDNMIDDVDKYLRTHPGSKFYDTIKTLLN